jgi:Family of unknown function (DUF6502)
MSKTRPPTDPSAPSTESSVASEQQALQDAVAGLMEPLARLAVARGMPYAEVEEMLKMAFVHAASAAHAGLLAHRKVSRISTATGINRREVTRLTQAQPRAAARGRSLASEVFGHWRTQRPYRGRDGQPKALPRQGPAPSFETLAQEITRDVHPRSLLDELCRLGLATWDEALDVVTLARESFVPQGDRIHKLTLLGDNVADHLRAAVENVLGSDRAHLEQAVFADGLSAASVLAVQPAISAQWQALMAALIPALETSIASDAELPDTPLWRMRVGLYTYQEPVSFAATPAEAGVAAKASTSTNPPAANPPLAPRVSKRKT